MEICHRNTWRNSNKGRSIALYAPAGISAATLYYLRFPASSNRVLPSISHVITNKNTNGGFSKHGIKETGVNNA